MEKNNRLETMLLQNLKKKTDHGNATVVLDQKDFQKYALNTVSMDLDLIVHGSK